MNLEKLAEKSEKKIIENNSDTSEIKFNFRHKISYITHYLNKLIDNILDQDPPTQHYGLRH